MQLPNYTVTLLHRQVGLHPGEQGVTAGFIYTGTDPGPVPGAAFYYLVSSENCLAESGLGIGTAGPIPNSNPCP